MNLEDLSASLHHCPYPAQLGPADRGILGWGFYPAALGYSADRSPAGGIMLLGRDWGAIKDYERWQGNPPKDETGGTSLRTRGIYMPGLSGIPVWRTNYLLGVRKAGPSTGDIKPHIAADEWPEYEEFCWRFLQQQVLLQKPALIVVFGKFNRRDLTRAQRLGRRDNNFSEFIFSCGDQQHRTHITFADHPYSLISPAAIEAAKARVVSIRDFYLSTTGVTH